MLQTLRKNKVVKNAGWIIAGKVANKLLAFVVGVFAARYLGPGNYGLINYAAAYATFFASLCTLGINSILVKNFVDHPEQEGETIGTTLLLRAVSSLLSALAIVGIVSVVDKGEPLTVAVVALYSIGLVFQVFDTLNYWFQSRLQSKYSAIAELVSYAAMSAYKIILLALGKSVEWFAVASALSGQAHRCEYDGLMPVPGERFCHVPVTHRVTLGRIVALLRSFRAQPETLLLPDMPAGSLEKKLYSTYLSYLPQEKVAFPLQMNADARGSFTELLKTRNCGQFSVNITKPGVTKGQHWHNSKWEFFIVVAGHGLIRERRLDSDEVLEFEVSGERIEAVHMLPGYTHSITNLSDTDTLVTVMWANECFDPNRPDTYFEEV